MDGMVQERLREEVEGVTEREGMARGRRDFLQY
jgi:hypothetical protein